MTASFNRHIGLVNIPAAATATFEGLDPAKYQLLALIKAATNAEFATIWPTIPGPLFGSCPVQTAIADEPTKDLITSTKISYPALFVWRDGEPRFGNFTLGRRQRTQVWGIEWILGPLEPTHAIHIKNSLQFFAAMVDQICQLGGHPAYPSDYAGTFLKQTLFDDDGCGFSESTIPANGTRMGGASFNEDGSPPVYYGCRIMIEATEIAGTQSSAVNAAPHTGGDFKFTGDAEGDDQEDEEDFDDFEEFVEVQSEIED